MARRRNAEAAGALPETHPDLTSDSTDFNPDITAHAANEHATTAALAVETTAAATPVGVSSAVATLATKSDPATEREPGDEAPRAQLPNLMNWITDTIAQVTFRTARDPYQAELVFGEGKPSPEARTIMKDAGFRWNPQYEAWPRPIAYQTAAQDREIGRRTAMAIIKQIREEKGVPLKSPESTPDF